VKASSGSTKYSISPAFAIFHRPLQDGLVQVVPAALTGLNVANPIRQSPVPIGDRQSHSTIVNPGPQSSICESAIVNRQSVNRQSAVASLQ
jgi:hypothetical protein